MNKKKLSLISITFLIIMAFMFASKLNNRKNSITTTDDPISNLINHSLSIQYGIENIELNSVFTEKFIDSIDNNSNFYKEKLAPYQITYKNYNLTKIDKNEYVLSVHIEDKNGSYIQVVHVVKEGERYLISDIEYDI